MHLLVKLLDAVTYAAAGTGNETETETETVPFCGIGSPGSAGTHGAKDSAGFAVHHHY